MNPAYGSWGDPSAWGETARASRRPIIRRSALSSGRSAHHCDLCGSLVRWETTARSGTVPMEDGAPHVCDPDRTLVFVDHRPGEDVLATLRRALNRRRIHGAAV